MPTPVVHLGPPATGKSHALHSILRSALQSQNGSVRLLVPTSTMAEHLRHKFSREGFLLRRNSIQTLHDFIESLQPHLRSPSPAQIAVALSQSLDEHCPPEYKPVASAPGFRLLLASTLNALNLAQAQQIPAALASIYEALQKHLAEQGSALRGTRLSTINSPHSTVDCHLLLDGFFGFANCEILLLRLLSQTIQVEIALPTGSDAQRTIDALAPEIHHYSLPRRRTTPSLVSASTREEEVLEIARQILVIQQSGTPLRDCAVVLRNPSAYAPLIESTFTRLAIPSRSYLSQSLAKHPLIQCFREFVAAANPDWEHTQILKALRWTQTGLGGSLVGDQLEFEILNGLPDSGLNAFPQLAPISHWPNVQLSPAEWAAQLSLLPTLLLPVTTLEPTLESAHLSQQRQSAIDAFHQCLEEATTALTLDGDPLPIPLTSFWHSVEAGFQAATLHERDSRREVVHILDLHEARQWEMPHIFAPGLIEGEFPQRSTPDPLLSDEFRRSAGMRTLADQDAEERQLYAILLTRATQSTTLLYPRTNFKGDPTLPSLLLGALECQPAPRSQVQTPPFAYQAHTGQLRSGYRPSRAWSASEFELYLQCPWKHFAQRGLALRGLPDSPRERLNAPLLGQIAHEVIAQWTLNPTRSIENLTERILEDTCKKHRVPPGYHFELSRLNLLRHLRLYAAHAPEVPPGWQTHSEQPFQFTHLTGIEIHGQIDRYDLSPTGHAHAYDFKYSKLSGLNEKYVQGGLYTQALTKDPNVTSVDRFAYVALREDAKLEVMEGERLSNILKIIEQDVESVVQGVSQGRIPVQPKDHKLCQYCDYSDACRIATIARDEEETYIAPDSEDSAPTFTTASS